MPGATHFDPVTYSAPCPCDACRHRSRCGAEFLACAAFDQFIHSAPWQHAPRAPTRAWFLVTFEGGQRKPGRAPGGPTNQHQARLRQPTARG